MRELGLEVIVCFKEAINEGELRVERGLRELSLEGVPTKLSEFDKNAIEEAIRLRERHGGRVTAITVAPRQATKVVKEALAMGCDRAIHLSDEDFQNSDTHGIALILASAIRKLGHFDLILCAEGSSDIYSSQVGPSLAELLDLPQVTYAKSLTVLGSSVRCERNLEEGVEVVEAPLPCLITVTNEINKPRLPTLLQIMAAGKKPILNWGAEELGLKGAPIGPNSYVKVMRLEPLLMERKGEFLQGSSAKELAQRLVEVLLKEGVLGR